MIKTSKFFPYLIICLFSLIVYLPSFSGEFILDDLTLIKNNTFIKEWHSLGAYLTQEDGFDLDATGGHTGYYRPLINLSYTFDYKLWGNNGPGFRITNLVLHILACFILYYFYGMILKKKDIAFLLVLLFALHPLATESVSWVSSRNNQLTTLFGIISLIFYIKAYEKERFLYYWVSILFFVFSLFCKEFGLMLLPIFFLYQRILNPQKANMRKELLEYLPYILVGLLYFYFRNNVTGSLLSPLSFSDLLKYICSAPYILVLNLIVIFFPYQLHSFNIDRPESILNLGIICGILFFILLIFLIWKYRKNRLILFSVLAFFLGILPVSGIVPTPSVSLIAMRWLYFPMVFILIILAEPFEKLAKSKGWIFYSIFVCIVLYLGVNSFTLNKYLWYSNKIFYKQEVLNFNNKYCAEGLAGVYLEEGKNELAMKYLEKRLEYRMFTPNTYIMYARLLAGKGDVDNALSNLYKAWQYMFSQSQLGLMINIRGLIYFQSNDLEKAIAKFQQAALYIPESPEVWENIGLVYGKKGEHAKAIESFKKAIRLLSPSETVYNNLALAYILNNECQKAIMLLDRKGFRENIIAKGLLIRAKECMDKGKIL
jgi:protein O-mannosyl-transferase